MASAAVVEVRAQRWERGRPTPTEDAVANEVGLAMVYNGRPFVVMMISPADIEDFVLGFSLSEGIIAAPGELLGLRLHGVADGIEAQIEIAAARFKALDRKQRNLTGRIGCGLCGAQTLTQAMRHPPPVRGASTVSTTALQNGMAQLAGMQPFNARTGALHAAGWMDAQGEVLAVREDVGRHNALDKLIGAVARTRPLPLGGAVLLTSRASHELVQKAAAVGIEIVCAISAPTALAIRVADETRVTLIGFAREDRYTAYTHAGRIRARRECVGA
jgi:FdhD protein